MPQQPSRSGEDDGPPDETKTYHTEGEHEEKINENVAGVRDSFDHLNDVKSSLVNEGESSSSVGGGVGGGTGPSSSKTNSTSSSQRSKRLGPSDYVDSSKDVRAKKLHGVPVGEGPHGGPLNGEMAYPEYTSALGLNGFTSRFANSQSYSTTGSKAEHFHDIARFAAYNNLAIIAGGYHPNGSMVPGSSGNKISMVHPNGPYPPSLAHLMMYNQEHYPPGTPPPPHLAGTIEVDAKTGIPRPRHSSELPLYHPLSPGSLGSVPHHLEVYNVPWQGQPFYPLTGALRSPYPTLINASGMSRIGHPGLPPPHHGMAVTGIPHPAIVTSGSRQQDTQQQSNDRQPPPKEKESKASEKRRAPHIKKPLNAFMLYMKEKRASVVKECTLKESAAINQILGRRWHALSREEQAKYYELARKERQLHMQLYPSWTARDNYAIHGKKKKKKKDKHPSDNSEPSTPKKCRARFGVDQQEFWCKPCRRKKKCIRYICSDENGQNKDDSCESDDEQDFSPPPSQRMPSNGIGGTKEGQDETRPPTSEPLAQGSTSHHQHTSQSVQSNGSHSQPRERAPSSSSSISEPRPPPPPPPPPSHTQAFTNASSAISTQPPTMHPSQSPMVTQTSPAIVHLPHPSISHSGHHMSFTSTSPMMVFPSQPSLFGTSQGDMLRGPAFPNGLTPHGLLQLHAQSRPPPTPEMPQDLSMKSATVTA